MAPSNISNSEYLSKDILDEDFMKVFLRFIQLQKIMGTSRIDARDRFITAPSLNQKIYSVVVFVINTVLCYFGFIVYTKKYVAYPRMYNLAVVGIVSSIFVTFCNIIHVRFMNKDENIKFYIKMQEIDRMMNISQCKPITRMLCAINNSTLIAMLCVLSVLMVITCIRGTTMVVGLGTIVFSYGVMVIEMAYCSNLMAYFFLRVRFVNSIIYNHIYDRPIKLYTKSKYYTPTNSNMQFLASQTHSFVASETDFYLKSLFECFKEYQDLYRFQILTFTVGFFVSTGLSIQFIIEGMKNNILSILEWLVIPTLVTVCLAFLVFFCVRLQYLQNDVKETKRLSVHVMAMYSDGPLREKAKKMFKIIEESAPRFSVYDVWYMDARIIIRIVSLLTTMLVTLLQFALL